MAELIAQRVPVTGEAGTGYVLDDRYNMPPLMLTADELEAAALGATWVASHADPSLGRAARDLVSKLSEAIPPELRPIVLDASSRSISTQSRIQERFDGAILRHAIRERFRLQLIYQDKNEGVTDRIVWPILIAYLNTNRYIVAWCETRKDFRHFKTDRVHELEVLEGKYPARRAVLIKGWEEAMAKRRQS